MEPKAAYEALGDVPFIDVREGYEFKGGHVRDSINIPLGDIPARVDELTDKGKVITVCKVGARSDEAARFLKSFGVEAENLDGGVIAWVEAGYELVTPDGGEGRVVM